MQTPAPRLETIPGKDLLTQPVAPIGFTIDTILPHGLFILAGSPKVGKSWLALDMCRAVTSGGALWNYPTAQGNALYLALEDNPARLQERLSKVSPGCDLDTPTDIHFTTQANKLGEGLAEQITAFLDDHPQAKLIVIDTMQYIRNTGKFTGTHSGDYHDMDMFRAIISERKITLLLITHTRKTSDADPINLVSGSMGLAGAVDGVFVLQKYKPLGTKRGLPSSTGTPRAISLICASTICIAAGNSSLSQVLKMRIDPIFELLNCLLDGTPTWSGTATQLCAALTMLDPTYSISPVAIAKTLKSCQDFCGRSFVSSVFSPEARTRGSSNFRVTSSSLTLTFLPVRRRRVLQGQRPAKGQLSRSRSPSESPHPGWLGTLPQSGKCHNR